MLIGISGCALVPISSRASAKPSRLVREVATFVPDMSSLSPVQQNQQQPRYGYGRAEEHHGRAGERSVASMSAMAEQKSPLSKFEKAATAPASGEVTKALQPAALPELNQPKERQPISAMRMSGTDGKPLSRRAALHAAAAAYVLAYKASPALASASNGTSPWRERERSRREMSREKGRQIASEKLTLIERRERDEREEREDVVLRGKTERRFSGTTTNGYSYDNKEKGMYVGAISGAPLFESSAKYDTGKGSSAKEKYDLGRAAFYEAVPGSVIERASAQDYQQALITGFAALKIWGVPIGVVRTEIVDAKSGLLLGHVYNAGPREVLRNRLSTDVVRWTPSTSTTDPIFKRYLVNTAAMTFVPADHSSK